VSLARQVRGAKARHAGRRAEVIAALWLIAKGYRVLGFRMATPQGEIDLLVAKGRVIAAVEVKIRPSLDAALGAVSAGQRQRLRRALAMFAAKRGRTDADLRLDLIALAPGRFPRHIPGAWREDDGLA
jgi:putative endonuclease